MNDPSEITQLRQAMETFLAERLQAKLEKEKNEDRRHRLIEAYRPAAWIADAARRVRQIQLVTHALKYTHPDARGTNLYSEELPEGGERLVGTHSLGGEITPDVVGNAAALDVFKFLAIEVYGKPLWQRAMENDPNLLAALPGDKTESRAWITAFATLPQPKVGLASHKLAKQLYWPLGDGAYHLLQPLFPSSLVHAIWERLRDDRFSEVAQAARQARREGKSHPYGYREWPEVVIQKFGGTKPQNISQLNTERHGEVWLLPSIPPTWHSREIVLPLKIQSLFERFGRLRRVRERIDELGRYLAGVRDWNNFRIRRGRARRVEAIIDELVQYTVAIRRQPPGWSAGSDCRLPQPQRFWLDPERDDPDFQQARSAADWPRQVAESFAAWLNAQLRRYRLPVGDAEFRAWRQEFEAQLHEILEEMET